MSPYQERSSAIDISINKSEFKDCFCAGAIKRAARATNLSAYERIFVAGASEQDYASVSTGSIQQEYFNEKSRRDCRERSARKGA
jgi:hypothetical protein